MFHPGKIHLKVPITVPIKNLDDKRQITSALLHQVHFYLSSLSIAVKLSEIYPSMICLVALMLPLFQIIGQIMKNVSNCLRKIIFPYLKAKKEELGYPKKQYSLIVMDTFKGQDNTEIKALSLKNDCKLLIVPQNMTNKLQPLDISINQKAKKFISHKFNKWYADRVSELLKKVKLQVM